MIDILIAFSVIMLVICLTYIVNDKFFHLPSDICLVIFSLIIFFIFKIVTETFFENSELLIKMKNFNFNEFLLEGILCFMIFAGASKVNFSHFSKNLKNVVVLSIISTILTTVIYGTIFYLLNIIIKFELTIWECVLLGTIITPTDPIAATAILKKAGLSKSVTSIIEGESLFNDGIGVALFICIKNVVETNIMGNFVVILLKNIFGAFIVGLGISFLLFKLLSKTSDPQKHILISLLAVSLIYTICEIVEFSGVIAVVVAGIYFSRKLSKEEQWIKVVDPHKSYENFWESIDTILNSILFVLIGFSIIYIPNHSMMFLIMVVAIITNIVARYIGLFPATFSMIRKVPNGYTKNEFRILLTWGGLKGGLSLALVLSLRGVIENDCYSIILIATFAVIVFTVIVQGLTVKWLYNNLENRKIKRLTKSNNGV